MQRISRQLASRPQQAEAVAKRLRDAGALTALTLNDYFAQITALRGREGAQQSILDQLETWGHNLASDSELDHGQDVLLQGDLHFLARARA